MAVVIQQLSKLEIHRRRIRCITEPCQVVSIPLLCVPHLPRVACLIGLPMGKAGGLAQAGLQLRHNIRKRVWRMDVPEVSVHAIGQYKSGLQFHCAPLESGLPVEVDCSACQPWGLRTKRSGLRQCQPGVGCLAHLILLDVPIGQRQVNLILVSALAMLPEILVHRIDSAQLCKTPADDAQQVGRLLAICRGEILQLCSVSLLRTNFLLQRGKQHRQGLAITLLLEQTPAQFVQGLLVGRYRGPQVNHSLVSHPGVAIIALGK